MEVQEEAEQKGQVSRRGWEWNQLAYEIVTTASCSTRTAEFESYRQ